MGVSVIKSKLARFLPLHLSDMLKGNKVKSGNVSIQRDKLSFTSTTVINPAGNNNKIIVSPGARLSECSFYFSGDNNTVFIGEKCKLNKVKFWLEDSGNEISLGAGTTTSGDCEFAVIEGTKITVGEDCMFSSDIRVCTGDSHSILKEGERINASEDVVIGNHVWVGTKADILKGSAIADGSVVGTRALVSGAFDEENIIIAGVPAKKIKENISWKRERI